MRFIAIGLGSLGLLLLFQGLSSRGSARRSRSDPLDRLCREAGADRIDGRLLLIVSTACFMITLVVLLAATRSLGPALAPACFAATAPFMALRAKRAKRRELLREEWPDALAMLIAAVRAGVSLPEACASLGLRGPQNLRPGWGAFTSAYRASGSFSRAIFVLREELSDPIADRVAAALLVAHDVGGTDLVRVLHALAGFVRSDLLVRKEVKARWSWTVTAARVAAASPWIVLLIMSFRPEAARVYASSGGIVVIAVGTAATVVGYRLMLRAGRLPEDRRLGP